MSSNAETVIDVRGLKTQYGPHVIHEHLDLSIRRGEILALVGGSGSGKTTLLRAIIMLLSPTAGSVRLFGQETVGISERTAFMLRRRFGMLFQQGALFSSLTIQENVAVPLQEHAKLTPRQIERITTLKIALAGLPPEAASKYPGELSGGMLKRASLARALALDPDILFLDEPTAGLDPVNAGALDELVIKLNEWLGLTVVMVTHDLDSLWRTTNRVAFLGEQRVLSCSPMAQLTTDPHPLIQQYFSGQRAQAAQERSWR